MDRLLTGILLFIGSPTIVLTEGSLSRIADPQVSLKILHLLTKMNPHRLQSHFCFHSMFSNSQLLTLS